MLVILHTLPLHRKCKDERQASKCRGRIEAVCDCVVVCLQNVSYNGVIPSCYSTYVVDKIGRSARIGDNRGVESRDSLPEESSKTLLKYLRSIIRAYPEQ